MANDIIGIMQMGADFSARNASCTQAVNDGCRRSGKTNGTADGENPSYNVDERAMQDW